MTGREQRRTGGSQRRGGGTSQTVPRRGCYGCVFYVANALLWMRTLVSGFPVMGQCANHPETPGQWRPAPGRPCRNFRARPLRVKPPEPANDKIRYIPLTRGLHAIVDAEDYAWLSRHKWSASRIGRKFYASRTAYARNGGKRRYLSMHREIARTPKGLECNHINGDSLEWRSVKVNKAKGLP